MAVTSQPSFTLDAAIGGAFSSQSTTILLPGTPASDACVRICNLGPFHITVALGNNTATVTPSTGISIPAGTVQYLTIGTATHIAGVAAGGPQSCSTVNIATGS